MCAAARPKQGGSKSKSRVTAETMAESQREISVSEFFAKNRHLLGFDNPRKALLTTVKEAVDNALDACEEAGILPDIEVKLEELEAPPSVSKPGRYRITITDNGPGIVRRQVENIFGKLLYGSKFHRMKMSRGQQGIGISAAGMYGLMTTGKPMVIHTKPNKRKPAHHIELAMDTTKNKPEVTIDVETDDFPETSSGTGTMVAIELEARYQKGKASVDAYLEQTAIANPHGKFTFIPPDKAGEDPTLDADSDADTLADIVRTTEHADRIEFPRTIDELPHEPNEIKPHPYGVELGTFLRLLKQTDETQLAGFFKNEFCRVPPAVVKEITKAASSKDLTITGQTYLSRVDHKAAERLYKALQDAKLRSPPTDCLSPIGVRQMLAGLLKGVQAEFYAASTRDPAVYRGNPFQIEAAIAFGGDLPGDQTARVIRFANRVPLLYQQSACSSFKAVVDTSWKNYGLAQPRGAAPVGPLVVMIHMASVWVPFTSESKEAIADYDEIRKEMKLALQECGRKLGTYIRKRQKMKREGQRRDVFERYIGEISKACNALVGVDTAELYDALLAQARAKTAIADVQLDEDGKVIKDDSNGRLDNDDGVLIVRTDDPDDDPTNEPAAPAAGISESKPTKKKRSKSTAKRQPAADKPKRVTKKRPSAKVPAKGVKNKGKPKPRVKLGEGSLFEG
ncbi:MAG: DNA topoisomerase VI subunit B [Phycisphaeraceae bacterium]|nr:MAG: DNA topoisomerase VI subunit B [Phycisphaeraceae bacterium]